LTWIRGGVEYLLSERKIKKRQASIVKGLENERQLSTVYAHSKPYTSISVERNY